MKHATTLFVLVTILLLTLLLLPEITIAQGGAPALPGGSSPTQNPIDGGLALLAVAGGGYAIKKLRERKE